MTSAVVDIDGFVEIDFCHLEIRVLICDVVSKQDPKSEMPLRNANEIFQIWIHFLPVCTNFINSMVYFVCSYNQLLIYHNIYLLFGLQQSSDIVSIMICYFQMEILQKSVG